MKGATFWEEYGWIIRGSQRIEVIKFLPDKPITAECLRRGISSKNNLRLSLREMSRHLTTFAKKNIVKCLTPNAPYGRLYELTKKGRELKKE